MIVGTDQRRATELMRALYEPFTHNRDRMIVMDVRSAELTKYAANAMLATKISFMNELANLAEHFGADIEDRTLGIGSDPRIGYAFIYPGAGYGGSCFPKDVQALQRSAQEVGYDASILTAVESVNNRQKQVLFSKIKAHFGDLRGKTIGLWGLAFKPNTDDMREAASRVLMEALVGGRREGARLRPGGDARMPANLRRAARSYAVQDQPRGARRARMPWPSSPNGANFAARISMHIKATLRTPAIFDGRNIYDPGRMARAGFSYYAIGRGKRSVVSES